MANTSDLLVVTSAGGNQCQYLLPLLYKTHNLRLIVRSESSQTRLKQQYPEADIVRADLAEPSQCKQILEGATKVYHIGPSLHSHETALGVNMIDAAIHEQNRTGRPFKHFIYSSVLNTQIRKMFNHDRKRYVEEYLIESGLNYTILSPGDFLNFAFPVKLLAAMERPEYQSHMGLESRSAFVVLEDYAEASAKVIIEGEKHYHAQYQMCSMPSIAYGDVARDVGKAIGKDMPISQKPLDEANDFLVGFLEHALGSVTLDSRDGVGRLHMYYRSRGLPGSPNTMEWVLGRKPTSHIEWIEKQLKEMRETK